MARNWPESPLPWQAYVLCRALEHDADGRLIHRRVGVSVPRQVGKSVLLRMLAIWRLHTAELFDEPQTILHVSHSLNTTEEVFMPALEIAQTKGWRVRHANGQMMIRYGDSRWVPRSTQTGYGYTLSLALVDEAWSVAQRRVNSGYAPTLSARRNGQVWLFSSANESATPLMPGFRDVAMRRDGWLMLEWSAPDGSDIANPEVWQACTPVPIDRTRSDLIGDELADDPVTMAFERLNRWPASAGLSWGRRLTSMLRPSSPVIFNGEVIGAMESEPDGSSWGAAVSDGVTVESVALPRAVDAVTWLQARRPLEVLCHKAVQSRLAETVSLNLVPVTSLESRAATALLRDSIGQIRWAGVLHEQLQRCQVSTAEGGETIDARRSGGPVAAVKASAWALWGASRSRDFWVM